MTKDQGMTAAVRRGIALLDAHGPAGWRGQADPHRLNMVWGDQCVLGRVYGDYEDGRAELFTAAGLAGEGATRDALAALGVEYGFQVVSEDFLEGLRAYARLTQAWRLELFTGEG